MITRRYALAYLTIVGSFLLIDAVWLATMTSRFYGPMLADLLREDPNLVVAAAFYLVYSYAILILAAAPAARDASAVRAIMLGGLLGLAAYGTYDMTNLATLKGWPVSVAVVDTIWGTCLTAACALTGFWSLRRSGRSTSR